MSLEDEYFRNDYHYRAKFVNKCIAIIKFSKNEKKVKSYKNLVFKMMKDIVKKNICNYWNLLQNTYRKDSMPERDELVAECYIIFDKCLDKFILNKKYNFYFYFNKSLSRNFFREYQKALRRSGVIGITPAIETVNKGFHDKGEPDTIELLIDQLRLSELEICICRSRMKGQKTSEFLKENPDITSGQYSKGLKRIKGILKTLKEKGEI